MKRLNKFYKTICLLGLAAVGTTSCEDWLTLYPQDRVVEEDFWEDKNDLEGVRYAAYKQMCSTIEKFAIWGDLRSDSWEMNQNRHKDQKSWDTYNEIMQAEPDSSMTQFDWSGVYTTINFCNKVLQHGEEILEKDKQFTPGEWSQMKAEMTGLRALNYFYLIRAFKDVPYTTRVINKDVEVTSFGLTNQLEVLDSIILDVEKVAGYARNRFTNVSDTKGLITNVALYAMLSDMYLWRASLHEGRGLLTDTVRVDTGLVAHSVQGDYMKCIENGAKALAILSNNNKLESSGFGNRKLDKIDYGLAAVGMPNCDMIENDFENVANGSTPELTAAAYLFGVESAIMVNSPQNSEESMFELQFSSSDDRKHDMVNSLYGYGNGTHFQVCEAALGAVYGGGISDDKARYDSRTWYSTCNSLVGQTDLGHYYCLKHCRPMIVPIQSGSEITMRCLYAGGYSYSNWIIYRITDIMLLKAEALTQLIASDDASLSDADKDYLNQAFRLVAVINKRSLCQYPRKDTLDISNFGTKAAIEELVLNERRRELMFEGKRWYDLVRKARRDGKTDYLKSQSCNKYSSNKQLVESKLTRMDAIYWPYNNDELKVNKHLHQNEAFGTGLNDSYE